MFEYKCTVEELEEYQRTSTLQPIANSDSGSGKPLKHLKLNDAIPFGKYKGSIIDSIIDRDLDYINWLRHNTGIKLSNEVYNKIDNLLDLLR